MSAEILASVRKQILFLLMPGFEEGTAVFCLAQMREAGLDAAVVGLSSTPVRGLHGIAVQPDLTLDEVSRSEPCTLLFISGGRQYLSAMLVDPRFYHLYQETLHANGLLASTRRIMPFLLQAGIIDENFRRQYIVPGEIPVKDFAIRLINAVENQQAANALIGREETVTS